MLAWLKFSSDIVFAGAEAQRVITLRIMKLALGGPTAIRESKRMISEKMAAASEAAVTLAGGGSPDRILGRYRSIMRANEKRLGRTKL